MKISYQLSETTRKAAFLATGVWPKETQEMQIDPVDATPEQRAELLELEHNGIEWITLRTYSPDARWPEQQTMVLDAAPADWTELLVLLRQMHESRTVYTAANKAKDAANEERIRQNRAFKDRMEENARTEAEKAAAAKAAAKAANDVEKREWAAKHGSEQLKRGVAADYNCQRLYIIERAAFEAPGYVVDYEDAATWETRTCPSLAALHEVERIGKALNTTNATIVWLTAAPRANKIEEEYDNTFHYQPREAIAVQDYHGKDLVGVVAEVVKTTKKKSPTSPVQIIEDNAGRLFIGREGGTWFDISPFHADANLSEDCRAYAAGDTTNWITDNYDEKPGGELIAEWTPGAITVYRNERSGQAIAGLAGKTYIATAGIELTI